MHQQQRASWAPVRLLFSFDSSPDVMFLFWFRWVWCYTTPKIMGKCTKNMTLMIGGFFQKSGSDSLNNRTFLDVKATIFGDKRPLRSPSHLFHDWVQLATGELIGRRLWFAGNATICLKFFKLQVIDSLKVGIVGKHLWHEIFWAWTCFEANIPTLAKGHLETAIWTS